MKRNIRSLQEAITKAKSNEQKTQRDRELFWVILWTCLDKNIK